MKSPSIFTTMIFLAIISCSRTSSSSSSSSSSSYAHNFLECLFREFNSYASISSNVYTPINSSYSSLLELSIKNLRFASVSTPKPLVIITPNNESQIPPVIYCAKANDLQIRTVSGGHDYEGISYVAQAPFVIVDLINLSEITVDVEEKTAWVGAGARIGSLYAKIAEESPILGFPAGACPTVGVGGHFSGGGVGLLTRKYGMSADNVIDARIVDVNGRILDRESMGEDLFWAIRGGGAASFGVIVAWKVKLVDVPEIVTVFKTDRTLEQNATQLIHKWQYTAPKLSKDLFIGIVLGRKNSTINASFYSLFLGGIDRLLAAMQESFPELGLMREECKEVSWIESVVYEAGFPIESSPQEVLNIPNLYSAYFKGKSDYVQTPISESGFEGIWRLLYEAEGASARIQMVPFGGRMAEISESALPFPHRAGNLYEIMHLVTWQEEEDQDSDMYISWIRRLENYLTPYVSRRPRRAYLNVRDLDLGANDVQGEATYAQARIWGKRYFNNNFDRLVLVKTVVDPDNFFRNEQSIPPLRSRLAQ